MPCISYRSPRSRLIGVAVLWGLLCPAMALGQGLAQIEAERPMAVDTPLDAQDVVNAVDAIDAVPVGDPVDAAVSESTVSEGAEEASASGDGEPPPPPPRYLSGRYRVTELDYDTEGGLETTESQFHFWRHGNRVKTDRDMADGNTSPVDSRFRPPTWYDFDRALRYQWLAGDDILFSYRVTTRERITSQIRGLAPIADEMGVYRLEINHDLIFDGHPCTLVLTGFAVGGRVHAQRWVWEANDLDGQVIRVVFPESLRRVVTVEFLDATDAPFDEDVLALPEGVPEMSGF